VNSLVRRRRQADPDVHSDDRAPDRSYGNSGVRLPCRLHQSTSSTLALDTLV